MVSGPHRSGDYLAVPPSVAAPRGKALVAALRKRPDVRDAEALAAWIGRVKKYKRMGVPAERAAILAKVSGGSEFARDDVEQERQAAAEAEEQKKYEAGLIAQMEKEVTRDLNNAIRDAGGIQTRQDLREEYRSIPNNFIRKDGLPGDEMAEYLKTYHPELGIDTENDLLSFFRARYG